MPKRFRPSWSRGLFELTIGLGDRGRGNASSAVNGTSEFVPSSTTLALLMLGSDEPLSLINLSVDVDRAENIRSCLRFVQYIEVNRFNAASD